MSREPIELRFWKNVSFGTSCWEWTGYRNPSGYGRVTVQRKSIAVHRWAYQAFCGPVPDGLELDHLCRVRHCVNPAHLEAVTHRINSIRGMTVGGVNFRKTHCPQGHAYEGENVIWKLNGRGRTCRTCRAARMLAKYGGVGRGHGRKHTTTVCPRGHPLHVTPAGQKRCKVCKSAENLRYKAKRRDRIVTA